MKIEIEISIYEKNGNEEDVKTGDSILIRSHWNRDGFVLLVTDSGTLTVSSRELIEAVKRSSGWK